MTNPDKASAKQHQEGLDDLVRRRRRELGLSLAKFAERAVDPETGEQEVKVGWLHRLESGEPVNAPRVPELRALAAAAQVSIGQVQDAAGHQFFGIDPVWSTSGEAKAFMERTERLTPEQREQLLRLIDSFLPPSE